MGEILPAPTPSSFLPSQKRFLIPIVPTPLSCLSSSLAGPLFFSVAKPHGSFPSFQTKCSTPAASPGPQTHQSSSKIVFIKGLPLSTSEGGLKKAFSEFGEISRVKLVSDKKTQQSLAFAYVWFASEDSAQAAIKEMDGKFFDGRFISVTIAKPGSCRTPRRAIPYRF